MRKFTQLKLLAIALFMSTIAMAQGGGTTVSGTVTDASQLPMVGVSVTVEGTDDGTITGINGEYTIKVPANGSLTFSFIGYKSQTVAVGTKTTVNVQMAEDNTTLDEVVVVGYGTQKKANLTGAVEQVTSEVFEGRPVANTTQMLQGAVPNLNLQMTDGKPMRTASYNVRGTTSVGQGGSALVLIDGVEGDPSLLNPDDIESVSVLKDAASSSIYGSRAPYGVVLITTKAAKTGKTTVNYSATFSIQTPTADYDYVSDGYTWAEHFYKAYYNYNHSNPSGINKTQQFSTAWLAEYKARKESGNLGTVVSNGEWGTTKGRWVYFHEGTDMYGELFKDNTFAQTHNISVSGSEGKFDYYLSGRYYNFAGIFNDDTQTDKYNAYNTRLKVGYQIYDWMKITNNFELSNNKYRNPTTYNESHNVYRNIADEGHPSSPLLNPDGTVTYSGVYSVADFLYGNNWDEYTNDQFKNTTAINTKFFDNKLRVNADFTYQDKRYKNTARKIRTPYSKIAGVIETLSGTQSYMSETRNYTKYMAFNSTAEYENTWGKHYFKGLIGYNYEQSQYDRLYATRNQMVTETVENINLTTDAVNLGIEGSWTKWRSAGAFFRVNYSFDDRYLLEVNGRYDGSSKFLPGNQWAFFPSVSAGWRLTEEPWFNVDPEWISNIKVRASWGELGNSAISAYSFDEKFSLSDGRWFNGVEAKVTSAPTPIPDNLTWETSQTFDVGIDLSLFRDRLNITADWYNRKTLDMYIVGTTLPDVFGASVPKGNFGEMTTTGFELSVGWRDRFQMGGKPFNYSIKATLADYVSTIDKYNNATKSIGTNNTPSYYEGMTIGELWGFTVNGLWQTNDEIDAAEAKAKAAGQKYYNPLTQTDKAYKLYPGDAKYEDLNGNGYIDRGAGTVDNPGDRRIIGNKDPRYIYNFNLSADWNGIFVSAFFQGVGKQDWMPSNEASNFWGQYNRPYNQMPTWHIGNYWTEDNPDAYLPRYTGYYGVLYKGTANANTRYMQDVSYIRLKNLQVGYNLPTKWVSKIGMKKAAIYFSGENLWTWSPMYKWSRAIDVTANIYGTDSERSSTGDGYNYPTMKSYSFGLNITF
jgi:TonB-linked SusC/RagA family outer membrane protein